MFFDSITISAGQLDATGSPQAPQGVRINRDIDGGAVTNNGIELIWNRNGESDFASYNVYGSLTESFTADSNTLLGQGTLGNIDSEHFEPSPSTSPWADTTFVFTQMYQIDNYVHQATSGEEWFFRVSAIDNDGNETLGEEQSFFLDTQAPTAGTVSISNLFEDQYLRSTSTISVTTQGWSDDSGISSYIGSISKASDGSIVASKTFGPSESIEFAGLTLDDFTDHVFNVSAVDGGGNVTEVNQNFTTYSSLLGDYDSDWDVDVEDLNSFANVWPNAGVETAVDIGPATGTSPYLSPTLDNTNDVKDLSVFSRNWLWTKTQGRTPQEPQEIIPSEFGTKVVGNQIIIELPEGTTAGRFELSNLDNIYTFKASNKEGYMVLENTDEENQYYEFEFGNLSSNDNQLIITVEGAAITNDIEFSYQLFSKDGLSGNGMMQLNNPDEFKLHQNYPNPFNNQTTIKYDIPSMMVNVVDVEIHIYISLCKLV